MQGAQLGPYHLIRELGTGATASVWLAEPVRLVRDLAPGSKVALKVLHAHWEEGSQVHQRFLREAEVGRLILHPNVVRVLDANLAEVDGATRCYIAMEYAEGQTLRALLEESGGQPETLCRHVAREVALGLGAIHRAGMVHRDVKPENIMLATDGRLKLMDLGVAQLRDATVGVTQPGDFLGSVLYAAPEQLAGQGAVLDGRTDLYALGWVLYELATGHHPFDGGQLTEVVHSQLHVTPRPLGEVDQQKTPFLSNVLEVLLAKDPDERPTDSWTLAAWIQEGERSAWWQEREATLREAGRPTPRRARPRGETTAYGRDDELERLWRAWSEAQAGDGKAMLILGEAGVGKTRLVDELLDRIARESPATPILTGHHPPAAAAAPTGAMREAYRTYLGTDRLEPALETLLSESPQLVRTFAAFLRGEPPPPGGPELPQEAIVTAFLRVAQSLASLDPVVLLIEDLHFAEKEGRDLFAALARAVPGHRMLLLGTARRDVDPEWLAAAHSWPRVETITLERLGSEDVQALLTERLRSERAATELTPFLARVSDGNPFFLFELVRGLEREGVISSRPDGRWTVVGDPAQVPVPDAVRAQIDARLQSLSQEDRAALDAASMCGFTFDPAMVARLLGQKPIDVLRTFARLERAYDLVHARGSRMVFDHHQVQESLYEALPDLLRLEYHRLLAETLADDEAAGGQSKGERAYQICEHYLAARRGEQALPHLDDALTYLEFAHRKADMATLLEHVLAVPDLLHTDERVRLLLKQTAALHVLGRREARRHHLEEALTLADGLGDPGLEAMALLEEGRYLQEAGHPRDSIDPLTRAVSLASMAGDVQTESEAIGARGIAHELLGQLQDAQDDARRRLEIAWRAQDPRLEASARGNLAQVLWYLGDHELAMEQFQKSLQLFSRSGDLFREGRAAGNLGVALQGIGEHADAGEQLRRALGIYRKVGYRRGEANALGNLGLIASHLGRSAEALDYYRSDLELQRECGEPRDQAIALEAIGEEYLHLGMLEESRIHLEEALRVATEAEYRLGEGTARSALAALASAQGDREEEDRHLRSARAIFIAMGADQYVTGMRLALAQFEARHGGFAGARPVFEEIWASGPREGSGLVRLQAGLALARERLIGPDDVEDAGLATRRELGHRDRMRFELELWELTGRREHLLIAADLLGQILRGAPAESRGTILTRAQVNRELVQALRDAGEPIPTQIG